MHDDYNDYLLQKRPSIVELFIGYRPPSGQRGHAGPLPPPSVVVTIGEVANRSLQLIPSRFDFSDNLIGAVRPDPRVLARFLADNFQSKDFIIVDCAPTESIFTHAAYHASGLVLVPVKPEYFATIGFPLLRQSLEDFSNRSRGHQIKVCGVVINNAFYDGGNNGGPEKERALNEVSAEAKNNGWPIYGNEIPHSRGFPKIMRGDNSYSGNASQFEYFADEFYGSVGL